MIKRLMAAASIMLGMIGCTSYRSTADIPAVTGFDAARYMGTWHEIARLPKWFERDLVDVTAAYSLEGDSLRVVNRGFRDGKEQVATAVGRFAGAHDVGEFEISFFRPFYGEYRIIWLSPACDVAMVTSDDRSSLWILSRRERLPTDEFNDVVRLASRWGFDISALEIDN